jgi:hypothetical protein
MGPNDPRGNYRSREEADWGEEKGGSTGIKFGWGKDGGGGGLHSAVMIKKSFSFDIDAL